MSTLLSKLFAACGYVPRGTVEVHEIRPVAHVIEWHKANANYWHTIRRSDTWKKVEVLSEDSMIQGMLPHSMPYRDNPAMQQAFVLGRKVQMEYLAELAVAPEVDDENESETDFPE